MMGGIKDSVKWGIVLLALYCLPVDLNAAQLSVDPPRLSDSAGRRIKVVKPFQRIISLYGAHTENLFTLGAQSQVIGVSPNDDWPPEVKSKPSHSYHDDLEKFLAVRPDLVLIRPMIDRGYRQLVKRLESHGVTVVSLQPSSLEQMYRYWKILGTLTGRPSAADEMTRRFKQTIHCLRQRTGSLTPKKRVYFEAIHDRMRTFAPSAMPIFVLETAGGINIAKDAAPRRGTNIADYGKERILSHGHDIDFYLAQIGPMNRPTRQTIRNEPGYQVIRAVRQDQIGFIDEKLVARPTMRLLTGILKVGQTLYPTIFSDSPEIMGCTHATSDRKGN